MKSLYIFRHGETGNNVRKIWTGRKMDPLTAHCISKSKKVAEILSNVEISQIYSSCSARVIETALTLSENLNIIVTPITEFQKNRHERLFNAKVLV